MRTLLSVLLLVSCSETTPMEGRVQPMSQDVDSAEAVHEYSFAVDFDTSTMEPAITLPDGTITHSYEEYGNAVTNIYLMDPDAEVSLAFSDHFTQLISDDLNSALGTPAGVEPLWGPFYIGSYVLTGGLGYGYTSGCIMRNGNYYAIRINTMSGLQVFDLHLAAYTSGSSLCLGIYQSVKPTWCLTKCTPTYSDIVGGIASAAMAIGISYTYSYVIANLTAPLAVAALGL